METRKAPPTGEARGGGKELVGFYRFDIKKDGDRFLIVSRLVLWGREIVV